MEKVIEFLKKYWWVIALIVLSYWFFVYRMDDTDKELLGK